MAMTSRRRLELTALTTVVVVVLLEIMSAVIIALSSSRLVEPIRRTPAIYADQSRRIQSLFFSDTVRGLVFDPELGWKYRAGWRDQTTVHNLAGLRSQQEYQPHPRPGTLRIAAFGDSFVYGNETRWTESWPALIEQADSTLEVLNYGVGGYGVDQAYLRFLREGRSFAPSIVLICFTTDDLRRLVNVYRRFLSIDELPLLKPRFELTGDNQLRLLPSPIGSVEDYRRLLDDPRRIRTYGAADQWYERLVYENPAYDWSAIIRLTSTAWIRIANRYVRHDRIYSGGGLNPESAAFRLQVAVFQAFRDSVTAAGDQPIIVFLPDRASVAARLAGDPALYAPLAARLSSLHMLLIDAGDAFVKAPTKGSIQDWFMPGGHYSPTGNLIVAQWLTPLLHQLARSQP
jgi:GDSL-like Lipase/Acylhydrolase family